MAGRLNLEAALGLPLEGVRVRLTGDGDGDSLLLWGGGERVGRATLEVDRRTLTIAEFCIEPGRRGFGLGSEAARLLITAAAAGSFEVVRARAPDGRGLAVYFWLRTGLRPLHGEAEDGGIWLERQLR